MVNRVESTLISSYNSTKFSTEMCKRYNTTKERQEMGTTKLRGKEKLEDIKAENED